MVIKSIYSFFEKQAYGVCAWLGNKLGIAAHKVRLSFIYLSFIALGSPIIIYLVLAFLLENKHYFKPRLNKRSTIWEL